MDKHTRKVLRSLLLVPVGVLSSCQGASKGKVDMNNIVFTEENVAQDSFGGLGVEWGAYEDMDKLTQDGWERVIKNMDRLGATRIRLMVSYDWICYNFDNKGTEDKNDDTWTYNFANKWAKNAIEILTYCQEHNIDVAFGAWNIIANMQDDKWGMLDEVSSDIRWAKITADVLDFLVNKKGFTCIKWFVNTNEPNYTGAVGSSKNALNTYEKWEQGVKNVRSALDKIGLNKIEIVGGDVTMTSDDSWKNYLLNISKNIPDKVADYGIHVYIKNKTLDQGGMMTEIEKIAAEIKKNDDGYGTTRKANIWEGGLYDGKNNETDCQRYIRTVTYGVRMADYTIQSLLAGINGICYWDFDDAMHFMYNSDIPTPKEWGMFSSLSSASANNQELRPWYHSSVLLTQLIKKGNKVYGSPTNDPELDNSFRCLATANQDNTQAGFVCVNQGTKTVEKTFRFDKEVKGEKLYIYQFSENKYLLGEDGFIEPNYVIDGSLNKNLKLSVEPTELVVVSTEKL